MKGVIANFRGSRRRKRGDYMLIVIDGISTREKAQALEGKPVTWTSAGKNKTAISGKVTGAHGNKGLVKAQFERGLPGQSLGQEVSIE
ncbi:50S ribosomal protein L35ae [Candidatus Woesearchaeota archaeon]|nr:50S ribosomal protein L35ae [Candidatus Woesearchaeota archaeon]